MSFKDEPTTESVTRSPCHVVYCVKCKCHYMHECSEHSPATDEILYVDFTAPTRGHVGFAYKRI